MRTELEIHRAHDALAGMLNNEIPVCLTPRDRVVLSAQADVLCWVLADECGSDFAGNLARLEDHLKQIGIVLERRADG